MLDVPVHINLSISLIEPEHPLNTSNKRTDIVLHLFISLIEVEHPLKHQIKEHTMLYLFISVIEVEHSLQSSNIRTHV